MCYCPYCSQSIKALCLCAVKIDGILLKKHTWRNTNRNPERTFQFYGCNFSHDMIATKFVKWNQCFDKSGFDKTLQTFGVSQQLHEKTCFLRLFCKVFPDTVHNPFIFINYFILVRVTADPEAVHGNTGCDLGIHPNWDTTTLTFIHLLIRRGQFSVTDPSAVMF